MLELTVEDRERLDARGLCIVEGEIEQLIVDDDRLRGRRSVGVPKVASSSWTTAVRWPSGRGSRPGATTTSAGHRRTHGRSFGAV
ncbi:hypothetical protein OHA25_13145 [Nonomuraea sp. NBC_00507]|uniref:hypothetical protein n=1 Tax=Nonomuraea sp. NBC_00507 TaxID=2976002 RepID=UPI002E180D28